MAHRHWETWVKIVFIPLVITTTIADFTTECQRPCDCRWQSGNKAAVCSNSSLKVLPANLSNDIQILDLSNNNLEQLYPEAFKKIGLSNLKKLYLKESNIEVIDRSAFVTLAIMIELDLSKNKIRHLHHDTFKGTEKLRLINFSNNYIDKLDDGLFRNLKYLQKVEASNNRIVRIGTKAFTNLPQLKILRFDGNKLSHMKPETLLSLRNLSGLDLHNNPWRCDCNLQSFRDWVITHNLYTPPTSCAQPALVEGKLWNELDSSSFACRPTILEPLPDSTVTSYDENVTLVCKVVGNPPPDVMWRFNGRTIELKSYGEFRYAINENTMDLIRWVNLTVISIRYSDRGNYTCVAENPGGRDEKSLTLVLSKYGSAGTIVGLDTDSFAILIGCITAIIIISGAALVLCYFTSQNNEMKRLIKNDPRSSNGEALIEGSVTSENEKSYKLDVNPITKPPRKCDAHSMLIGEVTEMSEMNKTLLEIDPVLEQNEKNDLQPEADLPKVSLEKLLADRLSQDNQAYPPDLLSFPLRGQQLSPTGTSTQNQNSPVKSPGYGVIDELGLNRFCSPNLQYYSPKGYVTLPRRPRADTPRTQVSSTLNEVIPYYDTFNMKLFHGTSYYSLNKSEVDLSPVTKLCSNLNDDEIEPAPSPAPGTPHAMIPRSSVSSPNIHNQLLVLQAMSNSVTSEHRPLKVLFADNERLHKSPKDVNCGYSVNVAGNYLSRKSNCKPPPKPTKRNSFEVKEPFLMNNCENATQV